MTTVWSSPSYIFPFFFFTAIWDFRTIMTTTEFFCFRFPLDFLTFAFSQANSASAIAPIVLDGFLPAVITWVLLSYIMHKKWENLLTFSSTSMLEGSCATTSALSRGLVVYRVLDIETGLESLPHIASNMATSGRDNEKNEEHRSWHRPESCVHWCTMHTYIREDSLNWKLGQKSSHNKFVLTKWNVNSLALE